MQFRVRVVKRFETPAGLRWLTGSNSNSYLKTISGLGFRVCRTASCRCGGIPPSGAAVLP